MSCANSKAVTSMTDEKLKQVCRVGQGKECCRYVGLGGSGFCCLKLVPSAKAQLDFRVLALEDITAQGDNCEGEETT